MTVWNGVDAYPLCWPDGWTRLDPRYRKHARYKTSFTSARTGVLRELRLLGGTAVLISSGIPVRRDKLPYATYTEPRDSGVAVYWLQGKNKTPQVIACDTWRKVADNLHAIELTIAAMRTIERSGSSQIIERAFTGFTALAASNPKREWWEVFGWERDDRNTACAYPWYEIEALYKRLCLERHPDRGGNHEDMVELNRAYAEARADYGYT